MYEMSYTIWPPGAGGTFLDGSAGTIPSRTEAVLAAIRHAILAGEMKPGQSLVEADLAQRLGVSKTPVREALKTLAGSGLVTMSPYRGAAVRAIDAATAAALYDLRLLLEPEAVRRAAASGAGTGPASEALARADAAGSDAERSLANREFHRALYAGCGNPLLVQTLDSLRDQTALVSAAAWRQEERQAAGSAAEPDGGRPVLGWQREAAEHRAILVAAERGDAGLAERLLRGHISQFAARHFPLRAQPAPAVPAGEQI
jgi:DNA-binding GntR family transcriptional regulator